MSSSSSTPAIIRVYRLGTPSRTLLLNSTTLPPGTRIQCGGKYLKVSADAGPRVDPGKRFVFTKWSVQERADLGDILVALQRGDQRLHGIREKDLIRCVERREKLLEIGYTEEELANVRMITLPFLPRADNSADKKKSTRGMPHKGARKNGATAAAAQRKLVHELVMSLPSEEKVKIFEAIIQLLTDASCDLTRSEGTPVVEMAPKIYDNFSDLKPIWDEKRQCVDLEGHRIQIVGFSVGVSGFAPHEINLADFVPGLCGISKRCSQHLQRKTACRRTQCTYVGNDGGIRHPEPAGSEWT